MEPIDRKTVLFSVAEFHPFFFYSELHPISFGHKNIDDFDFEILSVVILTVGY